jgi:hypothetical protein
MPRRRLQALLEILQRLLQLPLVFGDVAEDMQRIGLPRLGPQDLAANGCGLLSLAGLVKLECLLQK